MVHWITWIIYQIRNSNLLQYPNNKKYCRLYTEWDWLCASTVPWLDRYVWIVNPRLTEGVNYIFKGWQILEGTLEHLDISDGISTEEKIFNLCLTWWQRVSCSWIENQNKYWKFLRTIEGKWLYKKNSTHTWWSLTHCLYDFQRINPISWPWLWCPPDPWAAEYRFCSRVEYIWTKTGSVEICGVLTNFFD